MSTDAGSAPLTFMEALREKYCAGVPEDTKPDMYVLTTRKQRVVVEHVGAEKVAAQQARLDTLKRVSLAHMALSGAGAPGEIATQAPHIEHLDLSMCGLTTWQTVLSVVSQLPNLAVLFLHGNSLGDAGMDGLATAAPLLRELGLNHCQVSWPAVAALMGQLPQLEELHVADNGIHTLAEPVPVAPRLRLLDVAHNPLTEWSDVAALRALPALERLQLAHTHLRTVTPAPGDFAALHWLVLANTQLARWTDVDALGVLPSLTELRLQHTPLTDALSPSDVRMQVIARLGRLQVFNGSQITARERDNAERYFIRYMASETDRHSARYAELVAKHGAPADGTAAAGAAGAEGGGPADDMAEVLLSSAAGGGTQLRKRLPLSLTVGRVRLLVQRTLRLPTAPVLWLRSARALPVRMDDDLRTLAFYGCEQGSEIMAE